MNFFKKLIQKHVEKLKEEHEGAERMLQTCEKGTFTYDVINYNKKALNFRIVVLEALI